MDDEHLHLEQERPYLAHFEENQDMDTTKENNPVKSN